MRADRLLSLLLLLQTRGRMPARELAERLEVSERTIYRDLDALSGAGIPVYAERGPAGGCALLDSYRTNLTGLTEAEVCALFMVSILSPVADVAMSKALRGAWLKLVAALPPERRHGAEHVRQRIHLDPTEWFQPGEPAAHLRPIQEAVWRDRRLALTYRRGDGTRLQRIVDPYGLVAKASTWYLAAAAGGEVHVYRISRVLAARMLEEGFQRPADFDLAAFWSEWCARFLASIPSYPVTLGAAPGAIPALERIFGEAVRAQLASAAPGADGRVALSLTFDSLQVARAELLELGTMVEVLAPTELRASMRDWAAEIAGLYG